MSGTAPPATEAPLAPSDSPPSPPEPRIRPLLAGLIIGAACVLGLVVIGLVAQYDGIDAMPTGPALAPPRPTPAGLQYDQDRRRATYANVGVSLAGSPYLCGTRPESSGPYQQIVTCNDVVHANYSGKQSWAADTGFALVPAGLAVDSAPDQTAKAIFQRTLKDDYPAGATVSRYELTPLADHSDAYVLSARVNVAVPKLPTTYDTVVIVVMTAKDGQQVLFYSLRPNDASAAGLAAVQASGRTLTIS
jgi:hypothetical protein